jgi:23S rRNA (pseudouridine1915-N3)-methyltransferase
MTDIIIHAIGKIKEPALQTLCAEYSKRIRWNLHIKEFPLSLSGNTELNKQQEAQQLWPISTKNSYVIAMDQSGKQLTSEGLCDKIMTIRRSGVANIYFLIGGSDGHAQSTLQQANLTLSMGMITLPHQIARLILLEQIYRCYCIENSHPYHK